MNSLNPFHLTSYKYLFFDIFYRDNKIYLIIPIYSIPINKNEIKISISGIDIKLITEYLHKSYESYHICIYNYVSEAPTIDIVVGYKSLIKSFVLHNFKIPKKKLSITTLFKDDFALFSIFYFYYKKQGCDHFYMYYNGFLTDEIKSVFQKPDVTLIEWNYQYFNSGDCKYIHHAQVGQISHALYKYGKYSEYMIFCDLDEYLYIRDSTLINFILENPTVDTFGFCNRWSCTLDKGIPSVFPHTFLSSAQNKYKDRSKNIYKTSSVNYIGIHCGINFNKTEVIIKDLTMFHFFNWAKKQRAINEVMSIVTV